MMQPAWLAAAWAQFGVRERPGGANAPAITRYFRDAGRDDVTEDATPWCAAFVGAMLARADVESTRSLRARSYLDWGVELSEPRAGCVVVLRRGRNLRAGHVGFFVGQDSKRILLLGGNQGDAVSVAAFDRGRLLGYRWAADVAVTECGPASQTVPAKHESDDFQRALDHVLQMEGGFSDHPDDPGGPTYRGITLKVWARWQKKRVTASSREGLLRSLKEIPDATLSEVYYERYWRIGHCGELPGPLAIMHFDACVNHGPGFAVKTLQSVLGVGVDGAVGPRTRAAAFACDQVRAVRAYADVRRRRYRTRHHFKTFGRGWLRRVDATLELALRLAGASDISIQVESSEGVSGMGNVKVSNENGKWWGQSKTIWGAIITAVSTVLPVVGPLIGIELPAEVVRDVGEQTIEAVQCVGGLIGTLLTIYGRTQAQGFLMRRPINLKI